MADRPISSFTTTTEIDYEIARLADEIQEIELLHKNLQMVRKLLGSAISQAQSASKSPPVSPNNHTLNSAGTTDSSSFSFHKNCVGCSGGEHPSGLQEGSSSGGGGGVPVSSAGDMQRICACSQDNCIRICVNPRITQEMEQHFAAATAKRQQRSPPPSGPDSEDSRDNGNMGSPPPPPPHADNLQSSASSGGTGSTMAEFHVRRYPSLGSPPPGAPTSSGSGSTVAGFRIRRIPPHQQGQVIVGVPMQQMSSSESPYSNYCSDNSDPTMSSFQSNRPELNYFQQQYPHIPQHYQYSPQGQNNMTY